MEQENRSSRHRRERQLRRGRPHKCRARCRAHRPVARSHRGDAGGRPPCDAPAGRDPRQGAGLSFVRARFDASGLRCRVPRDQGLRHALACRAHQALSEAGRFPDRTPERDDGGHHCRCGWPFTNARLRTGAVVVLLRAGSDQAQHRSRQNLVCARQLSSLHGWPCRGGRRDSAPRRKGRDHAAHCRGEIHEACFELDDARHDCHDGRRAGRQAARGHARAHDAARF